MVQYNVEYEVNTPQGIIDDGIVEIDAENEQKARLCTIHKLKDIYPKANIQIVSVVLSK